ncbi:hydrophobin 2 [Mycena floridula]|nr:hydrophobin 2 [Mycena floridula]
MQFKLSALILAFVTLAVATPARRNDSPLIGVENADSPGAVAILNSLGIDVSSIAAQVSLGCSPISVIDIGNGACSTTTVYCEDNSHSLISLGCIPITA